MEPVMRRPLLLIAGLTAGLGLLAAGCGGGGGGSTPGVANVGATTTAQSGFAAFSACMRSRGFPNFPVRQYFVKGNPNLTIRNFGLSGPRFGAAMKACSYYLPTNATTTTETPQQLQTRLADALSFARCMRGRG